jgi:hypothetical protein
MNGDDPYADLKQHALTAETIAILERRVEPEKIRKRRRHFAMVPLTWFERLERASGSTILVAWGLLYLHWKGNGGPVKLSNDKIALGGVSRFSKWRALANLERRGLITIERRPRRSPLIRLLHV